MADPMAQLGSATVVQVALSEEPVDGGLSAIREIAGQRPDATALEPGTMVAIPERLRGARKRSMLERMTGRGAVAGLHRAARCTALLSKGYERIGGGTASDKTDWAWGFAPRSAPGR